MNVYIKSTVVCIEIKSFTLNDIQDNVMCNGIVDAYIVQRRKEFLRTAFETCSPLFVIVKCQSAAVQPLNHAKIYAELIHKMKYKVKKHRTGFPFCCCQQAC